MIVYKCDICGEIRECLQKEIDGKEYDLCAECWKALTEKLGGKGRIRRERETVALPLPKQDEEPPKPKPGEPPPVWYGSERPI